MNGYVEIMKNAISGYRDQVKKTRAEQEHIMQTYNETAAREALDKSAVNLAKARREAESAIAAASHAEYERAKSWATLDASKLTDDVKLLDMGVTPKQFGELVERYHDNYSMLTALTRYAERQNAINSQQAHGIPKEYYTTTNIPSLQGRLNNIDHVTRGAMSMLDMADATDAVRYNLADTAIEKWGMTDGEQA